MSRPRTQLGHDELTPLVLGVVNDADAVLVEGTGLFMAVRKGDRRWVTGSMVRKGLATGSLIQVLTGREPAMTDAQLSEASAGDPLPEPPTAAPPDVGLSSLLSDATARMKAEQFDDNRVAMTAAPKLVPLPLKAPARKRAPAKKVGAKKVAPRKR